MGIWYAINLLPYMFFTLPNSWPWIRYLWSLREKYSQAAVCEDDLQVPRPLLRLIHAVVGGPARILQHLVPRLLNEVCHAQSRVRCLTDFIVAFLGPPYPRRGVRKRGGWLLYCSCIKCNQKFVALNMHGRDISVIDRTRWEKKDPPSNIPMLLQSNSFPSPPR